MQYLAHCVPFVLQELTINIRMIKLEELYTLIKYVYYVYHVDSLEKIIIMIY